MTPPVVLTLGDPAGVGGEIALRAWAALRDEVRFFALGDLRHLAGLAERLGLAVARIEDAGEAASAAARGLPVLDRPMPRPAPLGRPDPANARAVVDWIVEGVALVRSGAATALCTGPIHKKALIDGAGFAFPGHTEFLAHLTDAPLAVMMLAAPALRVVPTTVHVALADVPRLLTADLLDATIRITRAALVSDFGVSVPRLAVAGLNPHAGEGGVMGREEIETIAPTLERLRAEGFLLDGPRSADTLFHPAARAGYDAAICMYHDQALIPLKTIDFAGGVNVTLGLPIVRTSPDHGTAYDLAPRLEADPTSLIAALRLARDMGAARARRA